MNWIQRFLTAIATHKADVSAHHTKFTTVEHTAIGGAAPHHAQAHTLASHTTKAHNELTGVTANLHHPQSHNAASHSDIASSGANIDDAVAKRHAQAHTLASHSTKAHTELTGVTTSQHHTKYTDASAKAAAVQAGAIVNGVTKAPTHDAVYDVKQTADIATTPAEVDTKILTHKNIAAAHHTKTIDASELTAGILALARLSGITNTQIAAAAAIAYSKLNLTGAIKAADIEAAAGIPLSKLEDAVCSETEAAVIARNKVIEIFGIEIALYEKTKDVSPQDATPSGVTFNSDGTKMYVVGEVNASVYQYAVSTPWDIATATYEKTKDVTAQDAIPKGVTFNSDGTKMYVVGWGNDSVYQYAVSTPWDIATASYEKTKDVSTQDTMPNSVTFNSAGTKMYVAGNANDSVYQYAVSTPWDIATATYEKTKDVSTQDATPNGVTFNSDGTKMYVVGEGNDSVYQYDLTTPWDIATASYEKTKDVSTQDTTPSGVTFNSDGTKMYVAGEINANIYQYGLG